MIQTHEQEIHKAVQEFLDDEFNLEDRSVGIYPVGVITHQEVQWINQDVEGFTVVEWTENSMVIECEDVLVKVVFDEYEDRWVVVN